MHNYNKDFSFFVNSDNNIAQVPKQTDNNPTEPETSIDEFLGLPVWVVGVRMCACVLLIVKIDGILVSFQNHCQHKML